MASNVHNINSRLIILTQTLCIAVLGQIPQTIGETLTTLISNQNEALIAFECHLGTGHEIKAKLATKARSLQHTTGHHTSARGVEKN